jgi:hypothetical protein
MPHPIEPRPVRLGTLAVRPDTTSRGEPRWAVLSNEPLTGLRGYKRGYGESHSGLYAYPFVFRSSALKAAHDSVATARLRAEPVQCEATHPFTKSSMWGYKTVEERCCLRAGHAGDHRDMAGKMQWGDQ